MGRKDKNKKKLSGSAKTALKTEKKLDAKQKKELAALGEDDIEKVIAEIEKEEARRQCIKETIVKPPSRRVNFTLTAHPFKDEIIMFGGEFHNGKQTIVYGDMFFYNIIKKEWTIVKAPGAPPPRCGHQAAATATNKGELWIFGGEFSSPSESQFYHYKDLWVFRLGDKKWEKITSPNGPSARSGHRMIYMKKQLIIFGGFHDNLRSYKYFNDVHIFNLDTYTWHKIEATGIAPLPRSGCILLPTSDSKLLVYGGYSKENIKKDIDKGHIHEDMFLLTPYKNDEAKYKWVSVKQTGIKISPRCSATGVLIQPNIAYIFGGVYDEKDDEEDLYGRFYNDLLSLDLEKFQWHTVTLSGKKDLTRRRRRRKREEDKEIEEFNDEENSNTDDDMVEAFVPCALNSTQSTIVDDDGIFTLKVGPSVPVANTSTDKKICENIFFPSPRINPGMVVKHNILYLYGGIVEVGDRQYTLSDFYSLDYRKLDKWEILIADDLSTQTWFDSSSDSESEEEDDEEDSGEEDLMSATN